MLRVVDDNIEGSASRSREVTVHARARASQEQQYRQQLYQIQKLERQLESHDEHLNRLQLALQNQDDESKQLVEQRVSEYAADPRNIAPEDALDTIVRLENHLKLQQRANQVIRKDLERDHREVKARRTTLHKIESRKDEVYKITGWDGRTLRSEEEQIGMRQRINEMAELAKRLREEHRAAYLIIHKKEHVVQFLNAELDRRNEQREQLDVKYNSIRVKDRDNREALLRVQELTAQANEQDNQITIARENQDTVAIECLRGDNDYLSAQLKAKKGRRLEQDRVMRAQADRVKQLTTRFEVIGGALRDLGLDRPAANALTAVPPAIDPVGEPDDMGRIQPDDEQVPTCMYELLIRDMASIRSAVARKDVMVVEKRCVVAAMEEKLQEYQENLAYAQKQERATKDDKYLEMEHLRRTLEERHDEYRNAIDQLLQENFKLKAQAQKRRLASK